eukprot:Gb_10761 [translate_table: standard]
MPHAIKDSGTRRAKGAQIRARMHWIQSLFSSPEKNAKSLSKFQISGKAQLELDHFKELIDNLQTMPQTTTRVPQEDGTLGMPQISHNALLMVSSVWCFWCWAIKAMLYTVVVDSVFLCEDFEYSIEEPEAKARIVNKSTTKKPLHPLSNKEMTSCKRDGVSAARWGGHHKHKCMSGTFHLAFGGISQTKLESSCIVWSIPIFWQSRHNGCILEELAGILKGLNEGAKRAENRRKSSPREVKEDQQCQWPTPMAKRQKTDTNTRGGRLTPTTDWRRQRRAMKGHGDSMSMTARGRANQETERQKRKRTDVRRRKEDGHQWPREQKLTERQHEAIVKRRMSDNDMRREPSDEKIDEDKEGSADKEGWMTPTREGKEKANRHRRPTSDGRHQTEKAPDGR